MVRLNPLRPDVVFGETVQIKEVYPYENRLYVELSYSSQKGRTTLLSAFDGTDLLSPEYNVKTRVHEYGGKASAFSYPYYYFVNDSDQGIYVLNLETQMVHKLYSCANERHGDLFYDKANRRLICVVEFHGTNVENAIGSIDTHTGTFSVEYRGYDFYAYPRSSEDGKKMAYLAWNRPDMPWEHTTLLEGRRKVCDTASSFEPGYYKGSLYYQNDAAGFWDVYRENTKVCAAEVDFGFPLWSLGFTRRAHFQFEGRGHIALIGTDKAVDFLYLLDEERKTVSKIDLPYTSITHVSASGARLFLVACSPSVPPSVIGYDLKQRVHYTLCQPVHSPYSDVYNTKTKSVSFQTEDADTAYGFFYPPPDPEGKIPLIINIHGGPTAHASLAYKPAYTFWISHGFALFDLNYRGSSGFGRAYRKKLDGRWGIADVEDAKRAALYLIHHENIDPERIVIRGGSAGGYTVLQSLIDSDIFAAGISYYGALDLSLLARETHKFEEHYFDHL
ncbi:MAG: hypothetical protein A3F09_03580, partial [Chlamydiae bacterium RIFCSPHIGHO2_12_FULL_49_11]